MRNLTRDEARTRSALLAVSSYDVELDLTLGTERFGSRTTVRFSCAEPGATTFLELDAELVQAELNGRPLGIEGNRIALPDLAADNVVQVVARGTYTRTGEGLHRFVDPVDGAVYVYAQAFLDDAQRFYACFDQPDLKAVFTLAVTAPSGWQVRSGTRGVFDGTRHVFAPTRRLSTYHLTLAAGAWVGAQVWHRGVELGVWCRRSLAEHLEWAELFDVTRRSLAYQEELFGSRYPFGDTYDQVFCPEFNAGAMENPGMVTFSDSAFLFPSRVTQGARRLRAEVVAHEMAHMWFGNLVTMAWWDDIWLNESFADLMGVRTVDAATDYEGAWAEFCLGRKAWGYRADQLPTTHPIAGDVADNRSGLLNFDGISYAKGAAALRQLMALVGDDVFFAGVRNYLARHAWGNSTLTDLLAALERAAGRDLSTWAQTWLRTPGVSTLRVREGAVHQESAVQREHRVGVARWVPRDGALVRDVRRELDVRGGSTPLPDGLAAVAAGELLLLNDGDLTFAKIRLDPVSLATALTSVGALADRTARALVWGSLWDMTRDAELAPEAFVAAVLGGVGAEDDAALVETLLQQALQAARVFAPPAAGLPQQLAEGSAQAAGAAAPGSDLQLARTRAFVAATADVASLEALLDGEVPAGLVVDVELRWAVVRRLSVLGAVDEARLQAELARDASTTSSRHAEWARSARPDPEAKAQAWAAVVGGSLGNAQVAAVAGGFWQHGQDELLEPYVDAYAEVVPRLWAEGTPQYARVATHWLFPSTLVRSDVVERVHRVLDLPDLPAGARRVVLEQSDDLSRALRARQAGSD